MNIADTGKAPSAALEQRQVPVVVGRDLPRPRSLWWVYLLITLTLAGLGIGAAQALFITRDLNDVITVQVCLAQHRVSFWDTTLIGPQQEFAACMWDSNRLSSVVMLVGAVTLPAASWVLMLGGGLGMRWRLRRGRAQSSSVRVRDAIKRFDGWCDAWQLTGRRRPRLVLVAPGCVTEGAFTTGLPLARPLVVVPLKYAYGKPTLFDVVILHELAHVQSRDLLWASSLWWTGWLSVPALLLAAAPMLIQPQMLLTFYGTSLGVAIVLSIAMLMLRAALLRSRELTADRYAIEILGDAGPLRSALGMEELTVSTRNGSERRDSYGLGIGLRSWLARLVTDAWRLFSSHPAPRTRIDTRSGAADQWVGGFVFTATAGLVSMIIYQSIYVVTLGLLGLTRDNSSQLPIEIALVLAGLLWAVVIVPAWRWRAGVMNGTGSPVTWWGPWVGAPFGLILGFYLRIPGSSLVAGLALVGGHPLLVSAWLGIITIGVSVLAAALAARLAWPEHRHIMRLFGQAGVVLAAATALTIAWTVTLLILGVYLSTGSVATSRFALNWGDTYLFGRFALFLFLVSLLVVMWTTRIPGRVADVRKNAWMRLRNCWRPVASILVISVIGGLAAALSWLFRVRPGESLDTTLMLIAQRWWICAFTGGVTLAAIFAANRQSHNNVDQYTRITLPADLGTHDSRSRVTAISLGATEVRRIAGSQGFAWSPSLAGLPPALLAGFATAALAGLLQFLIVAIAGYGRNMHTFQESLQQPMWLLFVMSIAIAPFLFLSANLAARIRAKVIFLPNIGYLTLAASITVILFALGLVGEITSQFTMAAGDYDQFQSYNQNFFDGLIAGRKSPTNALAPPVPTKDPRRSADPGRPLDQATVDGAVANILSLLPTGATIVDNFPDTPPEVTPAQCQKKTIDDYIAEKARPRTATIKRTYRFPAPGTLVGGGLMLTVDSYVTPQRDFTDERGETVRCAHFRLRNEQMDSGYMDSTLTEGTPPNLPYPAFRGNGTSTGRMHSNPVEFKTYYVSALVGHNRVSVTIAYQYPGGMPPPASIQQNLEQLLLTTPTTIIENLRSAPPK